MGVGLEGGGARGERTEVGVGLEGRLEERGPRWEWS